MDELYEYLKGRIEVMRACRSDRATIDMDHLFRLFHTVCYMKQIRGIIEFQDDISGEGKKTELKQYDDGSTEP